MVTDQPVALTQKFVREEEQQVLQRIEQAVKNDDEGALTQAVNDFLSLPSIVRLIHRACRYTLKNNNGNWQGSMSGVDDLEQEVKIKFYPNLKTLRSYDPRSVTAYLKKIVQHVSADGFRQYNKQRDSTVPLRDDVDLAVPPPDPIEPKLKKAMQSLKLTDKELLEMKFVRGYSLNEIAERTGMSRSNVHVRISAALKKVRKCLLAGKT